jgi:hemerythrin
MLQWTEEFETGEPSIDSQHKLLVGYINQLEGMSRLTNPDRQEAEFLLNLVDFVEGYTLVHFRHEEGCMVRHRCPAHAENQAAHADFLLFFRQFKLRFESEGCRADLMQQLHDKCAAWVRLHILRIDRQLKPCLGQASLQAKA